MEWLWKIPMVALVAAWGIYFWATPSAKVEKDLWKLRAWIKKRISKLRATTNLPDYIPFFSVSFYVTGGEVSNVVIGAKDGYEYICFDWDPHGEVSDSVTVVALRAAHPLKPMTWLARSAGIRIERVEDWVFAHDPDRFVSTGQRLSFVNEVMTFLEYATEFPQNR
jgi:hypothetical protein